MSRQLGYARAVVDRDATTGDGPLWFTAATEGNKRDGIDLRMSGAKLDRFRANPVIGYGHSYYGRTSLPIGRGDETVIERDKLRIAVTFDRDDAFAAEVERKYRAGFMSAGSIGFIVDAWEDPKTQNHWDGGVATEWELFEFSMVPLPMDASALAEGRGMLDEALVDSLRGLLDRLDADAIANLRALLERTPPTPAAPTQETEPVDRLARARRRLALAQLGI